MRASLNGRFSNSGYAEHFKIVRKGDKKLLSGGQFSGPFMLGQKLLVLNRICQYVQVAVCKTQGGADVSA